MINLNHTSDRLNFGFAAEKVRVLSILVESVVIADDVSLLSELTLAKPHGPGGNRLARKILGAAAANGSISH